MKAPEIIVRLFHGIVRQSHTVINWLSFSLFALSFIEITIEILIMEHNSMSGEQLLPEDSRTIAVCLSHQRYRELGM